MKTVTDYKDRMVYGALAVAAIFAFISLFSVAMAQSAGAGAVAGSESSSGAAAGAIGIQINPAAPSAGTQSVGTQSAGTSSLLSPNSFSGGGSANSASNASPTIVVGSGNTYEAPDLSDTVPTLFIPNLTTSNGTCANSFSVGGSAPGIGVSFGKTYVSGPCNARFNANQLNALGQKELAAEVMCGIKSVAEADARMADAYGTIPKCIGNIAPAEEVTEEPTAAVIWFDDKEMGEVDALAMVEMQETWTQGER